MLTRRLQYWLGTAKREAALRAEMESHIEEAASELQEAGMSEPDARAEARRRFGNFTSKQEASREIWISRCLSDLWQDLRYGARGLKRDPGFAAVAILSAALGIGACSTVFSIVNFALLRQLPIAEPDRVMAITGMKKGSPGGSMSFPEVRDAAQGSKVWEGVAAFAPFIPVGIGEPSGARRYWAFMVTANYFDVVKPSFVLGRGFVAGEDDVAGAPAKVVITHALWRSAFNSDPAIIGRIIPVNKRGMAVVGVTGPAFRGTEVGLVADLFLPFSQLAEMSPLKNDDGRARLADYHSQWVTAVGRLRPGVDVRQAQAELDAVAAEIRTRVPDQKPDRRIHAGPAGQLAAFLRKIALPAFALLLGVTFLVLLTACANIANLMLARASARRNEISIRMAVGAGRGRLIRQLMTESLLLALAGALLGLALAAWAGRHIGGFQLPVPMPIDLTLTVDHRVAAFSTLLAVVTTLAFGLVPALRATRAARLSIDRFDAGNIASLRRFGLRNALVVAQVAMSTILVICSALFLRGLDAARGIDSGMNPANVALVQIDPSLSRYDQQQTQRLLLDVIRDTGSLPGARSVSVTNMLPLSLAGTINRVWPEGKGSSEGEQSAILVVGPRFFETTGTPLLAGSDFGTADSGDPSVIVNQELARRLFPGQNPIGRWVSNAGHRARIVAISSNTKYRMLQESGAMPILYEPILARDADAGSFGGLTLMVRTAQNPIGMGRMVQQRLRARDPELVINSVGTMDQHMHEALFLPRLAASLFGLCGAVGLFIATIGIYGVVSFSVARRTREIGIRMALGGRVSQVVWLVMRHGAAVTLAGIALGVGAGLLVARAAGSLIHGVSATDPLTFLCVPLLLFAIGMLATAIPARRAARVDPALALRAE